MKKEDFVVGQVYRIRTPMSFRTQDGYRHIDIPQHALLTFAYFFGSGTKFKTFAESKGNYVEPVFLYDGQEIRHSNGDSRYFEPAAQTDKILETPNARVLRAKALRKRIEEAENTIKLINDLLQQKNEERMALMTWLENARTQANNLENYPDDNTAMTDMINKIQGSGELNKETLAKIVASFAIL